MVEKIDNKPMSPIAEKKKHFIRLVVHTPISVDKEIQIKNCDKLIFISDLSLDNNQIDRFNTKRILRYLEAIKYREKAVIINYLNPSNNFLS